jgi:hypothetical protein
MYSILALLWIVPFVAASARGDPASTLVFVDPSSQTVDAVGESFIVNVSITGVSNLYGYELKLYYNSTIVNGTSVIEGSFLKDGGSTFWNVVNFTDHYNSTEGVLYFFDLLTMNVSGVNGGGVLASVTFKSVGLGDCVVHLEGVKLSDPDSSEISHANLDGTVTIIPEFTPIVVFSALIIVSLFGVLIGKRVRAK